MVTLRTQIHHDSGIPLGGIGTGTVEINPDGYLGDWQIFNVGKWAPRQPRRYRKEDPKLGPDGFSFVLRVKEDGSQPMLRSLGMRTDQHDLYSLAWLKSVQAIEYEGKFPVARLKYIDEALPVKLEARFFSPFIPHDARTSGTPGFYVLFTVTNTSNVPIEASLLGILENPLAWDARDRELQNTITQEKNATILTMRTACESCCPPTAGSLTLSVTGGEASWIANDYKQYLYGYGVRSRDFHGYDSAFFDFRASGKLPCLGTNQPCPSHLFRHVPSDVRHQQVLLEKLKNYAFSHDLLLRYQEVNAHFSETEEGLHGFLQSITARLNRLAGWTRTQSTWGAGALCSSLKLQPGETRTIQFVLTWFFPNHYSKTGAKLGHMYENWFHDAEDVNKFLINNGQEFTQNVQQFANVLHDTTLDPELADAWGAQLTTLVKCTWWIKDGHFGVWEGLGCCGFHTTDITYQGSFNILALFPELQKSQMLMGASFQRKDGRVHHFFTPDLNHVDHGFDRVDMNPQFVLLVCRDFLWTGDKQYLQDLWINVVMAMSNSELLDNDGDGLPDHDTRRNTYDAWNFFGTPSYIASLWLAALRAAIHMAEALDDTANAQKWRGLLARGIESFDKKLWNGEYYSLWVDAQQQKRDEICMTDQLSGEWFAHLIGLGHNLPRERILNALQSVYKYNFNVEQGLLNATYPPGHAPLFPTHHNIQALAPWTGVEYAIASMMLDVGMVTEGTNVVKAIHDRYLRAGRFWSHVECGDHYYRAMSSWAILLAATGFKVDLTNGRVQFAPIPFKEEFRAPWFASTGWGTFTQIGHRVEITCLGGSLPVRELTLTVSNQPLKVSINDQSITAGFASKDGYSLVNFDQILTLNQGQKIVIE